ncbi:hypothetical protein DXG03_005189 [Asterophora parasitica]|uniref:Uncharacterized protein n=1 Tax=Asterophora parasitica TaxID=117018 RepID=A0A9P7GES2_9AGAR|nr:hypothetical protein DXG03_005189 [Asterophora parasitica]
MLHYWTVIPRRRAKKLSCKIQEFINRLDQISEDVNLRKGVDDRKSKGLRGLFLRHGYAIFNAFFKSAEGVAGGWEELGEALSGPKCVLAGEEREANAGHLCVPSVRR